jgi:hypothetical protein
MHQRVSGMLKIQVFIDGNLYLSWIPMNSYAYFTIFKLRDYSVYFKWEVACLQVLCQYWFGEGLRKTVKNPIRLAGNLVEIVTWFRCTSLLILMELLRIVTEFILRPWGKRPKLSWLWSVTRQTLEYVPLGYRSKL